MGVLRDQSDCVFAPDGEDLVGNSIANRLVDLGQLLLAFLLIQAVNEEIHIRGGIGDLQKEKKEEGKERKKEFKRGKMRGERTKNQKRGKDLTSW